MQTRVFQSGNSIAVRIPKELAIVRAAQDVEIERVGETLVIRPLKRHKLTGLGKLLQGFSSGFMATVRDAHSESERDWSGGSARPGVVAEKPPALRKRKP